MNYKLREMLSRINVIGFKHVITWHEFNLMRSSLDPNETAQRHVADLVSRHIAGHIMRGGTWRQDEEPEGKVFSVKGHWLTYDELYELLNKAYSLGRTEPVAIAVEKK